MSPLVSKLDKEGNRPSIPFPYVTDRSQAILIGQGMTGGEHLVFGGRPTDGHHTGGRIVHIDHTGGYHTGHTLCCALCVGVGHRNRYRLSHITLCQRVTRTHRPINRRASSLPLVSKFPQPVLVQQIVARGKDLILSCRSTDHHCSARRVIHVHNRPRCR